jgi:multiple sugar transport system ATP-binding protein
MIHVTHDQVEAMTLATRIAIMHEGRIQQLGTPDEVYHRPANRYVAAFLGAPGMNFIDGHLRAGTSAAARWRFEAPGLSLDLPDARLAASLAGPAGALAEGRPVTLGMRPEQLELAPAGAAGADCEGVVTLVEPHGGHRVIWLDCAGTALAVLDHEHPAPQALQAGVRSALRCGHATALLFDPATGLRL